MSSSITAAEAAKLRSKAIQPFLILLIFSVMQLKLTRVLENGFPVGVLTKVP